MVNEYISYAFIGVFALLTLLGFMRRGRRVPLWFGALCAAAAAFAARSDAFWPMTALGVLTIWSAVAATNFIDFSWRMRFGVVSSVGILAFIALWPTLTNMTGGRLPCPAYIQEQVEFRLVRGLDLRGGLRLAYTVDVDEAITDKRDRYYSDMRRELARVFGFHEGEDSPEEEAYDKLRTKVELEKPRQSADEIRLTLKPGVDPTKIDQRFLDQFRGDLTFARSDDQREYTFSIKEEAESQIRERAVEQAREIILRRVDELGLREAAVSIRDEDIIVEVPGEDESSFSRIRDIISQTARLEFKLVDDETDFFGGIRDRVQAGEMPLPEGLEFYAENAPVGQDDQGDTVYKQNTYAQLNMLEGESSQEALKRIKAWADTLEVPPDREIGFNLVRKADPDTLAETEEGWRTYFLKSRAEITGDMLTDAAAVPDQGQGSLGGWFVSLTFTDQGGRIFERLTGANIKRRFAVILDDRVANAPVIQTRIPGGRAQITMGSGDPQVQLREAKELELVLRSGALPAPISPINEQRIGPSLGRDSIRLGVEGALAGGVIVLIFMVIYYRRAGFIADFTVVMNLFLQLAILSSFGASMTLPGIAGLALTLGMSVDANVLINERIREELRGGKSPRAAVELGYNKAISAIIDGQLTTFISGVVLAQFGSGPIKGFAITLMVGVGCSIFTGVVVSRVLFDLWVRGFGRRASFNLG